MSEIERTDQGMISKVLSNLHLRTKNINPGTRPALQIKKEEKMKPCPMCGSEAKMQTGGFGEKFVTCSNEQCGIRFGCGIWSPDEIDMIKLWNKRV